MNVTIKDVARVAGVSVASVSRALNGNDNVTNATRQRIVSVAAHLRYMPNSAARSLITRRTHAIGVVLPDLHGEFFSELIRGMDCAARARGLHLLVSSAHGSQRETIEVLRALCGRVDGLLVMSPDTDASFLAEHLPLSLPTVLMNMRSDHRFPSLSIDNYGGARTMTRHLFDCGYRRIAFVAGPALNFDADERLRGYRDALASFGPGMPALVMPGDFSEDSGYRAVSRLQTGKRMPDAIFAANDMMAFGCLSALGERGFRVPDDIGLAGFDDVPIARFIAPPLTTMRVRIADLGEAALERLAAQLEAPAQPEPAQAPVSCELVVRTSCRQRLRLASVAAGSLVDAK